MRRIINTKAAALAAAIALLATLGATSMADAAGGADKQTVDVNWHAQQAGQGNAGVVDGASAKLTRTDNGFSYNLKARALQPGNAYTLWIVVVDNPAACANQPCTGGDVIGNPATESQVLYGTGAVAGGSGHGSFAGSVSEGALEGWLPDRALTDARSAEIHLVLNDHGPKLAGFMPGMIKTYRGGCADTSPFPGIFPPTALADGEVGPNNCLLYQAAIFVS